MNRFAKFSAVVLGALLFAVAAPTARAADDVAPARLAPPAASEALRICTKCHDETWRTPVLAIETTKHAMMADPRTPFADRACMSCHGSSDQHLAKPADGAKRAEPDVVFERNGPTPVGRQNAACLACHQGGLRMHWQGSAHDNENIPCVSCHALHTDHDPVLARETQPDVCITCHKSKRAEIHRPSTHPIAEGVMGCSDCHNPHGSTGPSLLAKGTVNETCTQCHSEKRGPFLWEHGPVREDCTICHRPHGSVNAALLKTRPPYLCEQCHQAPQHPSSAYSGTGLSTAITPSGAQQLLGKACLNCHSEVHGSNHPSGVRKTR